MIEPIFYILLIVSLVALPATVGWKLSQKYDQSKRMATTIFAGQMILTPGIALIALSEDRAHDEDPFRTLFIYAGMALVISIMTFAILEMRNARHKS